MEYASRHSLVIITLDDQVAKEIGIIMVVIPAESHNVRLATQKVNVEEKSSEKHTWEDQDDLSHSDKNLSEEAVDI